MKTARLANLEVGRLGLGAMGMSAAYAGAGSDDAESIRTVHRAIDLGVTLIDTAEVYGPYVNEELLARALHGRRDQVVLATKFGLMSHTGKNGLDSSPANIRIALDGSLQRLGDRPHRPVLPTPPRPRAPRSKTRSGRWPSWSPPARSGTSACPKSASNHPPRPRRAPDHRRAIRILAVDTRSRRRGVAGAAGAGNRFRRLLAAGPRLPHRRNTFHRGDSRHRLPQDEPSIRRRELPAQPAQRRSAARRSAATSAPRRPRSPWPGCWRKAPTSSPYRGPNVLSALKKTSPPTAWSCLPSSWPNSMT